MKNKTWMTFLLLLILGLAAAPVRAEDKASPAKDNKDMTADEAEAASLCPICKQASKLIYHFDYNGKTYHFFSRKCQKEFEANPAKYVAATDKKKN